MNSINRRKFLSLAGAGLGMAGLTALQSTPATAETARLILDDKEYRRRKRFVNPLLITHENRQVRFYDDLLRDKTVLINFIFANCRNEGLCPMMTYNLRQVQQMLGDRVGRDIFMYSITLEPEHDTPEVLRTYAEHHGIGPGWELLTGNKQDIELLRRNLGFAFADPVLDKDKQQHIGVVKYGIEALERWGTCPALTKPEAIVGYLEWMMPQGKRPAIPRSYA